MSGTFLQFSFFFLLDCFSSILSIMIFLYIFDYNRLISSFLVVKSNYYFLS